MNRRDLLRAGGAAAATSLAGCAGLFETETVGIPPVLEDRPDAVYYPTHVEGMEMIGMGLDGDVAIGVMYSYPHRFWTVTGTRTELVDIQDADSVHLMAAVWDRESGIALPVGAGLRFEITRDGETITERSPWPMLSQPMGFHFGDNVRLPAETRYEVTVHVGGLSLDRRGAFAGRFGSPSSVTVEFEYRRSRVNEIAFRRLDERAGEPGAVTPMEMEMLPLTVAPAPDALPGQVLGTGSSGDASIVVTATDVADGTYLAVSPRTPHNGYVLPLMALSATVTRDGDTPVEGALRPAIDPDRGYHYGTTLDGIRAGDEVGVTVDAPPQVSRHEGYETAFLDMPPVTVTA